MGVNRLIQINDFIKSYGELKEYSNIAEFKDVINPVDGVVYPHICAEIPENIRNEIIDRICSIIGRKPEEITMFMRRSPFGVHCPHIVHNDRTMGLHSLMLYMNDNSDGGTGIVRHKSTGIMYQPDSAEFVDIAVLDQNNPRAWSIWHKFDMKENSAALFDAALFHCALPIGGFGDGSQSRTVLTVFFS
jgi:hypothetical protein